MDSTKRYERLLERYGNGDLDRRTFLGLVGCAGIAAGVVGGNLTGWVRDAHAQVAQIRFDGWGGSVSDALRKYAFEPYTAKTGITVIDGGCPLMFEPTADFGHKVMRLVYAGHVPKQV